MTGNLAFATRHCALVEAIEECCPPVTAPYLQRAYDRLRLPIKVWAAERTDCFLIGIRGDEVGGFDGNEDLAEGHAEAAAVYRFLCAQLQSPHTPSAPTLPAETHGYGAGNSDVSCEASVSYLRSADFPPADRASPDAPAATDSPSVAATLSVVAR